MSYSFPPQIETGDIGDIFKIRLEHDNTNDFPAWHVNVVHMSDVDTGQEVNFTVNRWLAEDEEDGQLMREAAVSPDDMPGKARETLCKW